MSFSLTARITIGRFELFDACDFLHITRPVCTDGCAYEMDYRFVRDFLAAGEPLIARYVQAQEEPYLHIQFTMREVRTMRVIDAISGEAEEYINSFCTHLDSSLPRNQRRRRIRSATRRFKLYLC